MIIIVLPFLLIGKALKPLAKIKKKAWSAMGNAFKSMRASVDPMKSFAKIFEIIGVIMLPLTFLFTLLAAIILNELMPYIVDLIALIDDLGDVAQASADEVDYLNEYYEIQVAKVNALIYAFGKLHYWLFVFDVRVWALNEGLDALEGIMDSVLFVINELIGGFEDLFTAMDDFLDDIWNHPLVKWATGRGDVPGSGGDGGGGGGGDELPWWIPQHPIIPRGSSNTSNTVNINLSGAVIDNRDKLVRDIVEQVVIRIG